VADREDGVDLPHFPVFVSDGVIPGLWIAAVAIFHVFVAQFAVGGGALVVWFEWRAESRGNTLLRDFLHRFFSTLVLVSFVLGALSGVAIWLVTALIAPRPLLLLVREFHWIWAAEWCFFCLEVVCGYAYFVHGRTLPFGRRFALAIGYAFSAWMSLFLVNGILSFQLTPGGWTSEDPSMWAGFFNPTFWPTLIGRTVASLAIAGIVASLVVQWIRSYDLNDQREVSRQAAVFLLPLVLMPLAAGWFLSVVPEQSRQYVTGASITMTMFFGLAALFSLLVGGTAVVTLWRRRPVFHLPGTILLAVLAFCATGATEFVREGIRKPYIVYGELYSNGVAVGEVRRLRRRGIDTLKPWPLQHPEKFPNRDVRAGRRVYRQLCSSCHTPASMNGLVHLTAAWDRDMLERNIDKLHRLKSFMPPFAGDDDDLEHLVDYIIWLREDE
jgi:cytochrome d ubiquinol oxidase subunit I